MRIQEALVAAVTAGLVALPLASCATSQPPKRVRLSSQKMCEAAGGTYTNNTCHQGTQPRTAGEMCRAHGGYYQAALDWCELDFSGEP